MVLDCHGSTARVYQAQRCVFDDVTKGQRWHHPFTRCILQVYALVRAIDTQREILSNVLDAHLSLVSNRTNAIMKSLTLLSAIFLPLSFVTGFFGQNFTHLPFDNDALMWGGLALCAFLPVGMLTWFKRRKWL